jgi:hypothetical protein
MPSSAQKFEEGTAFIQFLKSDLEGVKNGTQNIADLVRERAEAHGNRLPKAIESDLRMNGEGLYPLLPSNIAGGMIAYAVWLLSYIYILQFF